MTDVDSAVQARVDNFSITIQKHLEERDLQGIQDLLDDTNHRDLWAQGVMQIFDVIGPFLRYDRERKMPRSQTGRKL